MNKHRMQAVAVQEEKKDITILDWGLFGIMAFFSFFLFNHADLLTTAQHSYAYLDGHVLDFYDACYSMNETYAANYLPSTFIIFAIWNIPLKVFGCSPRFWGDWSDLFIFWNKLLPTLLFFLSARVLYSIVKEELGISTAKAKFVMYAYLTAPVAFFSQLLFSQYDIFTVLAMLLGIKYYFCIEKNRKNWIKFVLFFGIAITFKYFAVLIFVVLLLLKEKRVPQILLCCLGVSLPFVIEFLLYFLLDRNAFIQAVLGFGALEYANASSINIGFADIRLLPLGICLIAAAAYFAKPRDKKELISYSVFYSCGMFFCLFSFMTWHPQWLLMAVPFWIIGMCINKNYKIFIWLELLFFLVFIVFVVNIFKNAVDQNLLKNGILSDALQYSVNIEYTMADFFKFKDVNILFSLLVVLFTVFFVFNHPRFHMDNFSESIYDSIVLLKARFVIGIGLFAGVALYCLPQMLHAPERLWCRSVMKNEEAIVLGTDDSIAQYATILGDSITDVYVNTWTNDNKLVKNISILLDIYDVESNELIAESVLDGRDIEENGISHFKVVNCPTEPGKQYKLVLRSSSGNYVPVYIRYGSGRQTVNELYNTVLKDYENDYISIKGKIYEEDSYHIVYEILGHYKK